MLTEGSFFFFFFFGKEKKKVPSNVVVGLTVLITQIIAIFYLISLLGQNYNEENVKPLHFKHFSANLTSIP